MVNHRLRGDEATEDPQFPKDQFPPPFLCPDCRRPQPATTATATVETSTQTAVTAEQDAEQQHWDPEKTLAFMLQFAQSIKPHRGGGAKSN
jgi:hypothetical protein